MSDLHELSQQTGALDAEQPAAPTLSERINDLRGEIFGAMAVVFVVQESIDSSQDYDRHCALRDAYERLDAVAAELDEIDGYMREAARAISGALPVQS